MADWECDRLDEYLCGWLGPEEAARFEAHLASCPACQDECALQREIDRLLAQGSDRFEPVPNALAIRIERQATRLRRRLAWTCALAAAVSLAAAIGLWAFHNRSSGRGDEWPVAEAPPTPTNAPAPPAPPAPSGPPAPTAPSAPQRPAPARVALVDPSSAILVHAKSRNPSITLVWVYPTVRVDQNDVKGVRSP